MANGFSRTVLPQIQRIFHGGTLAGVSDGELLDRFVNAGDEHAFEALIARHGRLVLGVCRGLLGNPDDVEDAFQATFLVLVRKARSIALEDSLGPWLYGVATRVASRARSAAARRETREKCAETLECAAPPSDLDRHDVPPILHEELTRLPGRLRDPIVLCYLHGMTHDQVSEQLRCPVGTVRSRLARGRDLLRGRLSRRGVAVPAAAFAACCEEATAAAISSALSRATVQAAQRVAAAQAAMHGAISAPVAALMKGVLSAMWMSRMKAATAASIVAGVIVTVVVSHSVQARDDGTPTPTVVSRPGHPAAPGADKSAEPATYPKTYAVGDLLTPLGGSTPTTGARQLDGSMVVDARMMADMGPLIEFLTSTVAPGSWRINDPRGSYAVGRQFHGAGSPGADGQIGSITPFFMSVSLIIRHTADVHDEIATRLQQLRRIQAVRDRGAEKGRASAVATPPEPRPAESNPAATPSRSAERTRKLLEALQREVDQLVREREQVGRFEAKGAPVQQ